MTEETKKTLAAMKKLLHATYFSKSAEWESLSARHAREREAADPTGVKDWSWLPGADEAP